MLPLCLVALAASAPAAGALDIHAHRGGTLDRGTPVAPENTAAAFRAARGSGADVLELDVHQSKDGVPYVIHDATLDRTTDCAGVVAERTAAEIDACHVDILGNADVFTQAPGATEPVPRLADVLAFAKSEGDRVNVEINHYPNEPAYDSQPDFVETELDALEASGIPKSRILVQSFFIPNLAPAEARGFHTAIITFDFANSSALQAAREGGYEVLEPQWPVEDAKAFVRAAHKEGKLVIPFTIDAAKDVRAARAAGVDGLITDDPPLASATLACDAADRALRAARKKLAKAKAALRRARTASARRRAKASVARAQRGVKSAARKRRAACG